MYMESFLGEDTDPFLLHIQYHGCWWSTCAGNRDNTSHCIDCILSNIPASALESSFSLARWRIFMSENWVIFGVDKSLSYSILHDDIIKWKHFPRYWPFVWGIHRSPVNSPHKGQWRGALMFSLIWGWINGWVNNGGAGDLRRYRAHYDVTAMSDVIDNRASDTCIRHVVV